MRTLRLGRAASLALVALAALSATFACGGDDTEDGGGEAGQAGSGGAAAGSTSHAGEPSGGQGDGGTSSAGDANTGGSTSAGDAGSGGSTGGAAGATGVAGDGGAPAGAGGSDAGSGGADPTAGGATASGAGGAAGDGGSGLPPLEANDFPGASPCPNQALLTDADAFAGLQQALTDGMVVYLDVPYDGDDPEIFEKKCGRPGGFDPAIYVDEVTPFMAGDPDLSDIVTFQNGGICSEGFDTTSFGTGDGFPTAGEYRKEFRTAYMDASYQLRARIVASGSAAGETFADQGVLPNGTSDLIYEVEGSVVEEDALWDELINAMSASADNLPAVELDVRLEEDGDVVFTSVIELICAAEIE